MNDDDLGRQLRQWPAPPATESARARARHRALIAFQQRGSKSPDHPGWMRWALPALGFIVLAVVAGLSARHFFQHHAEPENLATDRELLQQVQKLFPDQVNAVVVENGKVDLSIAQDAVVGTDQPVVVVFKRGQESIRVLSYSGHHFCLMLGKTQSCFDVLATPTGGIILEGGNKVWIASEPADVAGFSVRAQALEASL